MKFDFEFALSVFGTILAGAKITILITVVSLLIAIPLSFLIAMIRLKKIPVLKQLAEVYISFVRGTPLIVQIYLIYYIVPGLLTDFVRKVELPLDIYSINPIIYAFVVFSLSSAASLSEVFRSSLATVDKGQREAALASGLNNVQAYWRIILPQVLVIATPNICTSTVNLIKGTSLAFALSVQEITAIAKVQANMVYKYFEVYVDIIIIYVVLCFITEKLFKLLEKRLNHYKLA